jgi:hypothetical protein
MAYGHATSSTGNAHPGLYELFSGDIRTNPVLVVAGTYLRGQVLSLNGNNYEATAAGNQANAAAVMPFDITLTAPTLKAVYTTGDFNEDKLLLGDANLDAVKTALRKVGINARKWGAPTN